MIMVDHDIANNEQKKHTPTTTPASVSANNNYIKGMRILVMLLLDTLPMLGNVLLLCFFVFFIFGIIGVQLWEGMCVL